MKSTTRTRAFAPWIAMLLFSATARADDKVAAQASFDLGRQLMVEGRFVEACPKLEESLRLQAGVGAMLFLGACYEKVGRTASAWAQFREAESLATRLADSRAQVARERANALEPKLAKLTVDVPARLRALPKLEIKRNGALVGAGVWGAPIAVDPGAHRVVVTAAGKKEWIADVTVAAEDVRARVSLPDALPDAPSDATSAAGPAPEGETDQRPDAGRTQRIAGLAVGGAGVVVLGVSAVFGLSAKSSLDDSNADGHCRGNLCDRQGTDARNDARDAATISTVTFFVGLAAVAGGAALYLTTPRATARTSGAALTPWLGVERDGRSSGGFTLRSRF